MKRSSSSKDLKLSKADKKSKRNVKIKFTLHLKSLLNLSPALNDSDVSIAWKRGSKKSNKVPIYCFFYNKSQLFLFGNNFYYSTL